MVLLLLCRVRLEFLLPGLQRLNGAGQPLAGLRVRGHVLKQHLGVTAQTAPAGHCFLDGLRSVCQMLELVGKRRQPRPGRLGQRPAALALAEDAARILEPSGERRGVLRRHRIERVPRHLQFGDALLGACTRQSLDRPADCHAVDLLLRRRLGARPLGRALLLSLGNGLPYRLARSLEPRGHGRLDLDELGLQLSPRQAGGGQRRLRLTRIRGNDQPVDPGHQRLGAHPGLGQHRMPGRRIARRVQRPQAQPRAPDGDLAAGMLGHLGECLAIIELLQRADSRVSVLAFGGDVAQLRRVRQARERPQARGAVAGVTADRAERLWLLKQVHDGRAHCGVGVVAGHRHSLLRALEVQQELNQEGRARGIVGLDGQATQAAHRLGPHLVVGIRRGRLGQHLRVVEPGDGRAPHPRLGVLAREAPKCRGVLGREGVQRRQADRRIRMLPVGSTKPFKDTHCDALMTRCARGTPCAVP